MTSIDEVKLAIDAAITAELQELMAVNQKIHSNPELAWQETIAHETLTDYLASPKFGFKVTPSVYGIQTAFEALNHESISGERCVNFNAEYDALPGIGHACGHNLIATASLTAFLALTAAVKEFKIKGTVQLLGTPAEEDGGGKNALLAAGAFKKADVSIMSHPTTPVVSDDPRIKGAAGARSIAHLGIMCTFKGKNAHAGMNPWDGVNALDALVCAYNNISVLRQQMKPDERVHGCILNAPKVTNVIPDFTKVNYSVRSPSMRGARTLGDKVIKCFQAAGLATGCEIELEEEPIYADLRVNKTLCDQYTTNMLQYDEHVLPVLEGVFGASTDQGNVTYEMPALHAMFGIPGGEVMPHNAEFAHCAGTKEAFECAVIVGKAMALTGWEVLTNDKVYESCRKDFEEDKKSR